MIEFISNYFLEILCGGIVAVVSYFMRRISNKVKRLDVMELAMQALLRNSIISGYNDAVDRGYCGIVERDNLEKMYSSYHELGGNGTITELMSKVRAMPTEENTCGGEQA